MGGRFMVASALRIALAGVSGGDHVGVEIELDTEPREVAVPDDLARALQGDAAAAGREGDRDAPCGAHALTAGTRR